MLLMLPQLSSPSCVSPVSHCPQAPPPVFKAVSFAVSAAATRVLSFLLDDVVIYGNKVVCDGTLKGRCWWSVETELMRSVGRGSSLCMEDMEFWTVGDTMEGVLE